MYDYYDYGYTDYGSTSGILGGALGFMGIMFLISGVVGILMLISQWKIYKKAGKAGWECLIPIYNIIVLLQIVELPIWYIVLYMIPIANIYAMFKTYIELAHKFGKSTGFGVGLTLLGVVFFPMLAFEKNSTYNVNNVPNTTNNPQNNTYNPMNSFQFGQSETQENNLMNNNNVSPQVESTPLVFNQNINTEINPVEPVQNVENTNLNNPIEAPVTPILNQVMPNMEPTEVNQQPELNFANPVNTEPQVLNTELNPAVEIPTQESAQFSYNPSVEPTPVSETIPTSVNPVEQNVITEPTPVVIPQPQPELNVVEPQNVVPQSVLEPQTLNVIPGINQTPVVNQQVPENNQNNTTM